MRWFYNFTVAKSSHPSYDKFHSGTVYSDDEDFDIYQHVVEITLEKYPDADMRRINTISKI